MDGRILFHLLLCMFMLTEGNIRWLGIQKFPLNEIWEETTVCSKENGFNGRQVKFCKKRFSWMFFTQDAALDASDECKAVLKDRKWNCQSIDKAPSYNADLKKDTRESAFVYSLAASSLALTVSRGCMAGKLKECSCAYTKRQVSFPSDVVDKNNSSGVDAMVACKNIMKVGQKFAYDFMHAGIRSKPKTDRHKKEIAVRKHNVNIGLKELEGGEYISCTCNGATAGCVMKFCHRRLSPLQDISARLVKKFIVAKKVKHNDFYNISRMGNGGDRNQFYGLTKENENEMLYLDNDVNYCSTNKGQYSSTGRRCILDNTKPDSCNKICCGKGYRERMIEIHSKCRCVFVYCCYVKCDTCKRYDKIYECK